LERRDSRQLWANKAYIGSRVLKISVLEDAKKHVIHQVCLNGKSPVKKFAFLERRYGIQASCMS
jgi:hypothetical protein